MTTIFTLDPMGCFVAQIDVDPLAALPRCTLIPPPATTGFEVARWKGDAWEVLDAYPAAPAPDVEPLKAAKNAEINAARLAANQGTFHHLGKPVACDPLSRSDIDGVNGFVALTGSLPPGWPGAWKAADNSLLPIPDVAAWTAFYGAMVAAGNANFGKAQQLKAALEAASTVAEVAAVVW